MSERRSYTGFSWRLRPCDQNASWITKTLTQAPKLLHRLLPPLIALINGVNYGSCDANVVVTAADQKRSKRDLDIAAHRNWNSADPAKRYPSFSLGEPRKLFGTTYQSTLLQSRLFVTADLLGTLWKSILIHFGVSLRTFLIPLPLPQHSYVVATELKKKERYSRHSF